MPLVPKCDCFVVVGEPSGDAYGAAVVKRLLAANPNLVVAAMGGEALREAGAEIEQGIDGLAVMGLFPVLKRLPEFIELGKRMKAIIRARRPKVVLTIDYPGFNFRLVKGLKDLRHAGTRFVHVVAPQVWAWRPRRAKRYAQGFDRLLCFFPFEPPFFVRHGGCAEFVGHPLVDLVDEDLDVARALARRGDGERLLLLAPGSREREVATLLPVMDAAVRRVLPILRRTGPVRVVIAKSPNLSHALYRGVTDFPAVDGGYRGLCAGAHLGVIASGTATLEAALLGLPLCICYRGDPVSARLVMNLIKTKHVGLPNIVHGRRVVPELIQDELTEERLAARIVGLWDGPRRDDVVATLAQTRALLGGGGAMDRIAEAVVAEIERGQRRADTMDSHAHAPSPAPLG
ncbi:MAG: lipid-A-disaccharide synthase [Planctomycetota bacterium]|nr:lipid-A-disaccharide synthase [Planctomycetota bacterium]